MASNPVTKLSAEEYLALDRAAERKSEFLEGDIFCMSGVSFQHDRIQMNLIIELAAQLRDRNCEVFSADVRVGVSAKMYTYPDLSIVCGKLVAGDEHQDILLNPAILFEILSPSTEKYDRGLKFQHYRTIESLKEYILVDQDKIRIEQFTRQPDNTWTLRDYQSPTDQLKLSTVNVSVPLQRIYDRVEIPAT